MAHNWVKIKSGLITFLFSQMRVFPSLSVKRSQVGTAVAIFLAAFSSSSVVYSMDPSSVAGKILFYDGERNSEASLEIRVSSDGRTYQATMRSGKYVYKCEKSNLLPNGFLDFAECGDMDDLDPNREGRNPLLYVEGELEVPVSRTRSVHGYGLQLEFSLNKDKTMMAGSRAKPKAKATRMRVVKGVGKEKFSTKSELIDRSKLQSLIYINEANEQVQFKISKITPDLIQFDDETSLVANFIHDGGKPYSPGHSRLETFLQNKDRINKNFLNSPVGATLSYQVMEEWNQHYDMLWKVDAEVIDRKKIKLRGLNIDAVEVQIRGESIESTVSSSWAEEGIKFKEKLLIDSHSKIILTFDRVWEATTSNSPPQVQKLVLKEYQLKNGAVVTLRALSRIQLAQVKRRAAEEAKRRAIAEVKKKAAKEAKRRQQAVLRFSEEYNLRALAEANRKAEARLRSIAKAKKKAAEEAKRRAIAQAKREEAKVLKAKRRAAIAQAKREAGEQAKRRAIAEAVRKIEEEVRRRAIAEAKRKAAEEAKRRAIAQVKKEAAEEAKRRAVAQAKRKAAEEAKRRAIAEVKKKAAEEARRRAAAETVRKIAEEVRRRAIAEAKRKAAEEAKRRAIAQAKRKAAEKEKRRIKMLAMKKEKRVKDLRKKNYFEINNKPGCFVWSLDHREKQKTRRRINWSGACVDSLAEGKGVLVYHFRGDGKWFGGTYSGNFIEGNLEGITKVVYLNGDKFIGNYAKNRRNGRGTFTWLNRGKYIGAYKDGLRHGQGTEISVDGSNYVGSFKNDKLDGKGIYTFSNGQTYIGAYKNGLRHGKGTETFANGSKYVGSYKNNKFDGQGTYTWQDGRVFTGSMKPQGRHGKGVEIDPIGHKYVGNFKDDKRHGAGTYTCGPLYVEKSFKGMWSQDRKTGSQVLCITKVEAKRQERAKAKRKAEQEVRRRAIAEAKRKAAEAKRKAAEEKRIRRLAQELEWKSKGRPINEKMRKFSKRKGLADRIVLVFEQKDVLDLNEVKSQKGRVTGLSVVAGCNYSNGVFVNYSQLPMKVRGVGLASDQVNLFSNNKSKIRFNFDRDLQPGRYFEFEVSEKDGSYVISGESQHNRYKNGKIRSDLSKRDITFFQNNYGCVAQRKSLKAVFQKDDLKFLEEAERKKVKQADILVLPLKRGESPLDPYFTLKGLKVEFE